MTREKEDAVPLMSYDDFVKLGSPGEVITAVSRAREVEIARACNFGKNVR